jgi:hypothetical protein
MSHHWLPTLSVRDCTSKPSQAYRGTSESGIAGSLDLLSSARRSGPCERRMARVFCGKTAWCPLAFGPSAFVCKRYLDGLADLADTHTLETTPERWYYTPEKIGFAHPFVASVCSTFELYGTTRVVIFSHLWEMRRGDSLRLASNGMGRLTDTLSSRIKPRVSSFHSKPWNWISWLECHNQLTSDSFLEPASPSLGFWLLDLECS